MLHMFAKSSEDFTAKLAALDRVQAVIEFDLNGTILHANSNFLGAVGYTLAEIKGQHHSMFVEPGHKDSAEYRALWDRLRAGQFEAGQFKRLGKGGREIWIEASYNPLLDRSGKPSASE
jgi:methyl-accepting chemotaxis protein